MPSKPEDYARLFKIYTTHANGKELVGQALGALVGGMHSRSTTEKPRVLDVGAGNGDITKLILPEAGFLQVVEPNPKFADSLTAVRQSDYAYSPTSIQDYTDQNGPYDVIILSYFLELIDQSEWRVVLNKLHSLLTPDGKIIGVTYLDGCAWDSFAALVEHYDDSHRKGGTGYNAQTLRQAGFNFSNLQTVRTELWGSSVDNLYDNLEFFFMKRLELYRRKRPLFINELGELTYQDKTVKNRVVLPVDEVIFEILKFA